MNITPDWLKMIIHTPDINTNIKLFGGHKQTVPFNWKAKRETHYAFEIIYIIEGIQRTTLNDRHHDFQARDIILIPPGVSHENHCISKEGMTYFCIHFDIDDPEIQQKLLMYCPLLLDRSNESFEDLLYVLKRYIKILDDGEFTMIKKLVIQSLIIDLVIRLIQYADHAQENIKSSNNSTIILATKIASRIQENFHLFKKNPTDNNKHYLQIQQVSESLGISESLMLKEFKEVYYVSPKQYLDQLRYNEAKSLLVQPSLSITRISELVGYQNVSHFSRQFKSWNGNSPQQYRNNHKI